MPSHSSYWCTSKLEEDEGDKCALFKYSYRMGEAYNESYTEFGSSKKVNYCNKLFSLWDYNITDPKVVKIKKANNRTDLQVSFVT